MLTYLEHVFGNSNRHQNAQYKFWILHKEGQDFNSFWAKFFRLLIELDWNKSILISNLTFKLSYKVQQQLINEDKQLTNLFKYAKCCQCVYQKLKGLARAKVLEESMEQNVVVAPTPIHKISTKVTIRIAKSGCQPVLSEKDQLIKKRKCFLCRKVGHKTMDCLSKRKLTSQQTPVRVVPHLDIVE